MTISVAINGETHQFSKALTLFELLDALELPREKVALERNREIVARSDYERVSIVDGDQLEIVHFIGGG